MEDETVKLFLTVCDTEEASNIITVLTDEDLIISANITASADLDHSFNHPIKNDTEVTITITVEEKRLEDVMRKIRSIHDQGSYSIKVNSDHPSAKAFKEWSATNFFPDNY